MDENKLLEGLLQGDNNAFRELVSLYQDKVYNTIRGFVGDEDDAMELCQDVFIEVYCSVGKFRRESSLPTWIYRLAVNKSLNHKRSIKKNVLRRGPGERIGMNDRQVLLASSGEDHPQQKMEDRERRERLHHAIDSLPRNQRIAFVLSELDELPYKEIAKIMDISLSSVESLIFRARKNLQAKLIKYLRQ